MISAAGLAMLVHAIGTPAFRLLLPAATSSAPLLIDLPTPSNESWRQSHRAKSNASV